MLGGVGGMLVSADTNTETTAISSINLTTLLVGKYAGDGSPMQHLRDVQQD
jgi:hypothetical protein